MKKIMSMLVLFGLVSVFFVSYVQARTSMLSGVNSTCGTNYNCGLCHIDPKGGGPLTSGGTGYGNSGNDSCYFCASKCGSTNCTDADNDNYFLEATCGTSLDCNDRSLAINPGAVEVCNDSIDNDCDGKVDCADSDCTAQCPSTSPEVCNDLVDNDGDLKVDCADRDCRNDPACASTGTEGKGKTCSDGKDNDGNGFIDCADTKCAINAACK